jgi:hypothetical protein
MPGRTVCGRRLRRWQRRAWLLGCVTCLSGLWSGTMSQTPSLLETINAMLTRNTVPSIGGRWVDRKKEEEATPVDRAFLESWRKHVDDPIWSKTLATVRIYFPHETYAWIVVKGLRVNRLAEGMRSGDWFFERRQKERQELLDQAGMAEALATYFSRLDEESVAWFDEFLHPVQTLVKLHLREAKLLRERAGDEPKPTVPAARQDRRGGEAGLRVRRAFIGLIAEDLDRLIPREVAGGFNHLAAIVAFARIKFPEVDADVVRKTLEPTTREGRRRWRAAAPQRRLRPAGGVTELLQWDRRRSSVESSANTSGDSG